MSIKTIFPEDDNKSVQSGNNPVSGQLVPMSTHVQTVTTVPRAVQLSTISS